MEEFSGQIRRYKTQLAANGRKIQLDVSDFKLASRNAIPNTQGEKREPTNSRIPEPNLLVFRQNKINAYMCRKGVT